MEEKLKQAADSPVPATDQAPEEDANQVPSAAANQGESAAAVEETSNEKNGLETTGVTALDATGTEAPEIEGYAATVDATVATSPEIASEDTSTLEATSIPPTEVGDQANTKGATAAPMSVSEREPTEPADATSTPAASATAQDGDNITMEDVLAASDEQLTRKPIHRGIITTCEVIMLSQEGIVVDVGAKIEGMLPYNQLFEFETTSEEAAKYFKPGDEIQVYVVRADIPNNTIVLSKKRADQERAWNLLQEIYDKQKPVEVEVVEKVRGGLVANLGIRAFLPASQVDVRRVSDLTPYVGQRLKVKIIELNRKRNRVIISRRSILEEEIAEKKKETLQRLEPGLKLEGEIVEITDFGAFVNLGGIDGLVHRSELTHGRFNHPRDVVKVGDKVKVEVLDMDLERERINLSMKKLIPNPWENVLTKYNIGQKVAGVVTNLTPFGAFVEIEPGLEGLIHVSEMSWTKRIRHPKEVLAEGEEVEALILKIDTTQERISLGLRQTQPDPWSSLPDRFPPGTEITGPITGITDFGVFMEIEEGIEGLVHISELAHEHIEDIGEHFKKGDEITAVILNIDPVEQRASLSRKRLLPYTASEFDASGAPMGEAAPRGGRKGRRGGRRSQGIDYDYSYAAADVNTKTTTKLGDVYADLFAQFGLSESKEADTPSETSAATEEARASEPSASSSTSSEEVATEAAANHSVAPESPSAETAPEEVVAAVPDATAVEEAALSKAEASEGEEDIDPENAIDAAEAAALLTAAFREGKRPPKPVEEVSEPQEEAETSEV